MPQRILIDADPGIGDALAILVALADPALDVVGLTAVRGAVTAIDASRNLQTLLELADPPKRPRIGVPEAAPNEVAAPSDSPPWHLINGQYGMGPLPVSRADLHHPLDAAKLICDLSREFPHELTILTLGPLTNLAIAAERDPELLGRLQGIYVLGGTWEGPGNVSPVAEFNIHANPASARQLLRSAATKTLIPWDIVRRVLLSFDLFQRLPLNEQTPGAHILSALLGHALRAYHQHAGIEGMWLSEVAAVAAISRPELFQRSPAAIDVDDGNGLARGMTVFDRRTPPTWRRNIDVLSHIDVQGVLDYFQAMVRRICS